MGAETKSWFAVIVSPLARFYFFIGSRSGTFPRVHEHAAILCAAFEPVPPNMLAVQPVRMLALGMAAAAKRIKRAVAARIAIQFMQPTA